MDLRNAMKLIDSGNLIIDLTEPTNAAYVGAFSVRFMLDGVDVGEIGGKQVGPNNRTYRKRPVGVVCLLTILEVETLIKYSRLEPLHRNAAKRLFSGDL